MAPLRILLACVLLTTPGWAEPSLTGKAFFSHWGYGSSDAESVTSLTQSQDVLCLNTTSGFDTWFCFPNTGDLNLDCRSAKLLRFDLKARNSHPWQANITVTMRDRAGHQAHFEDTGERTKSICKGWVVFELPLPTPGRNWKPVIDPQFQWQHVASLEIHADTWDHGFELWLKDVRLVGASSFKLPPLDGADLSVTYAEQTPVYRRYRPEYPNDLPVDPYPDEQHEPELGERIVYQVHVRNVGKAVSPAAPFHASVDQKTLLNASIPALRPGQETVVAVPWHWQGGRHLLKFQVTPTGLREPCLKNNSLSIYNDAYTFVAYCEEGMAKGMDAVRNGLGSCSFEDWLRYATVDQMNDMMRRSTYDFAPHGADVSVRLQKIVVVPKLLEPAKMVSDPFVYDGAWTYPEKGLREYRALATYPDWPLLHELSHQVGLIDDYRLNLEAGQNKVNKKPNRHPHGGLMGGGDVRPKGAGGPDRPNPGEYYADLDVFGLNQTKGKRRGYYGEFLYCLPRQVILELRQQGRPLVGVEVDVYQQDGKTDLLKGPPINTEITDSLGRIFLKNRPAPAVTTPTGCRQRDNPFGKILVIGSNGLLMLRTRQTRPSFGFVDLGQMVVAYARGQRDRAVLTVELTQE